MIRFEYINEIGETWMLCYGCHGYCKNGVHSKIKSAIQINFASAKINQNASQSEPSIGLNF